MADFPGFPYAIPDFMDMIEPKLTELSGFGLERFDLFDMMGTGHSLVSVMASPKWKGRFNFHQLNDAEERLISSRVRKLQGSLQKFFIYDPRRKYPLLDPTGSIVGSNTVQIKAVGAGNNEIQLKGLPAAYEISVGDRGQIAFGTDSNWYFEFGNNRTADGIGDTGWLEIFPHVPIGIAVNNTVILKKPACKVALVQNGFEPGNSFNKFTNGISIEFLEQV